jgi:hypothetical protein
MNIEVASSNIAIYSNAGDEYIYWDQTEWEEDPSIVPNIVNAVSLALEDPNRFTSMFHTFIKPKLQE